MCGARSVEGRGAAVPVVRRCRGARCLWCAVLVVRRVLVVWEAAVVVLLAAEAETV